MKKKIIYKYNAMSNDKYGISSRYVQKHASAKCSFFGVVNTKNQLIIRFY